MVVCMKPREQDMSDELRGRFQVMKQIAASEGLTYGIHWMLSSVLRTEMEQTAFYAQGRETLENVNKFRKDAGMYLLTAKENENEVTWTRHSKHFPDDTGKSRAFDFCVLKEGRTATWDTKWDNDKDAVGDYIELARIAKRAGLDAGAFWKTRPDAPHVQLPIGV